MSSGAPRGFSTSGGIGSILALCDGPPERDTRAIAGEAAGLMLLPPGPTGGEAPLAALAGRGEGDVPGAHLAAAAACTGTGAAGADEGAEEAARSGGEASGVGDGELDEGGAAGRPTGRGGEMRMPAGTEADTSGLDAVGEGDCDGGEGDVLLGAAAVVAGSGADACGEGCAMPAWKRISMPCA